jgi:non-ribosomal peptide synthetase component F
MLMLLKIASEFMCNQVSLLAERSQIWEDRPSSRSWTIWDWPRSAASPERSTSRSTLPLCPRRSPHLPRVPSPSLVGDRSQILVCDDVDNTVRWKAGERLDHLFERRCDQVPPDHLAVITEDVTLTFRELDNRANQAARYLLDQGLKAGERVGVLFEKTIHRYVALLAVMKIGAAYVPLDASFPTDRSWTCSSPIRPAATIAADDRDPRDAMTGPL